MNSFAIIHGIGLLVLLFILFMPISGTAIWGVLALYYWADVSRSLVFHDVPFHYLSVAALIICLAVLERKMGPSNKPAPKPFKSNSKVPTVVGRRMPDWLIRCHCPHCGEEEFRIYDAENFCHLNQAPFYLIADPYVEGESSYRIKK